MTSNLTHRPSVRKSSSHISRIYHQASKLFLTRRLPESLSTLLPVLIPPADSSGQSLIASACKKTRVKVWSLYLTILNAICELGPDEGKQAFGANDFKLLVSKVRHGTVWDEVVKNGYGGLEADVDTDVVINLATLLLGHARNQKLNQAHLETYLVSVTNPNFDQATVHKPHSHEQRNGGTETPQDLNSLVRILELYCLHVLLRNNEWEYSKECITLSSILDEERKEAFLDALHTLQEEHTEIERMKQAEQIYREKNLKRSIEEARQIREVEQRKEEEERARRDKGLEGSEIDYGVEEKTDSRTFSRYAALTKSKKSILHSSSSKAGAPAKDVPSSLLHRATVILNNIYKLLESAVISLEIKPLLLLKATTFVLGLLFLLGRQEIKYMIIKSWIKLKQTIVMGGKVTYI
ncbi:hypothetical protein K3495_g841 [Podosphaera aphanis]|nr:hypothetical protein K3495_g841 [Podosphaera aphanis]